MVTGEVVGAIGMTEPGAGSDLQSMRTSAILQDDHYLLNGSKTFISNGQHADLVVLAVKPILKRVRKGYRYYWQIHIWMALRKVPTSTKSVYILKILLSYF